MTVDSEKRIKDEANQNGKVDKHQKKNSFSFPDDLLLPQPKDPPAEEPQCCENQFAAQQRNLNHALHLLKYRTAVPPVALQSVYHKDNLQSTETAEKAARFLDGVILDVQACLW
jgi:hypothetical protein